MDITGAGQFNGLVPNDNNDQIPQKKEKQTAETLGNVGEKLQQYVRRFLGERNQAFPLINGLLGGSIGWLQGASLGLAATQILPYALGCAGLAAAVSVIQDFKFFRIKVPILEPK